MLFPIILQDQEVIQSLPVESVIQVIGTVGLRPASDCNPVSIKPISCLRQGVGDVEATVIFLCMEK